MAWTLIRHGQDFSTDSNGFTSKSYDTSGADTIYISVTTADGTGSLSDNKGNTWSPKTQRADSFSDRFTQVFIAKNATVGTGHTFTFSGTGNFPSILMLAYSGGNLTEPYETENFGANGFNASANAGSVTPAENGALIISTLQVDDPTGIAVDSGLTIQESITDTSFGHEPQTVATLVQGTAGAINVGWTWTNSSRNTALVTVLKPPSGVTIAAASGSYALTGTVVALPRKVTALSGAYSISGTAAGLQIEFYKRPSSDVADGGWTDDAGGTSLFAAIDEAAINDADYIQSGRNPSNDVCEIKLPSSSETPASPAKIKYRYWRTGTNGAMELRVRLLQGATQIASWTHSAIGTTVIQAEQTLSAPELASITDFSDLRLEFRANWA